MRQRAGALFIAIRRDGVLVESMDPSTLLVVGDMLYLARPIDAVGRAVELLSEALEKSEPSS